MKYLCRTSTYNTAFSLGRYIQWIRAVYFRQRHDQPASISGLSIRVTILRREWRSRLYGGGCTVFSKSKPHVSYFCYSLVQTVASGTEELGLRLGNHMRVSGMPSSGIVVCGNATGTARTLSQPHGGRRHSPQATLFPYQIKNPIGSKLRTGKAPRQLLFSSLLRIR